MSATFIVTTRDHDLYALWGHQLPAVPLTFTDDEALYRELQRPGARVWIRDITDGFSHYSYHPDTVLIVIGTPRSLPFEEAKGGRIGAYFLSYEESETQLRRVAAMAAELAQKRAILAVMHERPRRTEPASADTAEPFRRSPDDLEFLAASIDHLEDRSRIIDEFRRGVRSQIRSSRVMVFLREGGRFVAESEGLDCAAHHDLVQWLREHAAIVDSSTLDGVDNAAAEAAIRQKLGEWNCRVLIPLEVLGALEGWVAFGPRADGRPYSNLDRDSALMLVRLLSRLLGQHKQLRAARAVQRDVALLQKHGPRFCVLGPEGVSEESLPVEAREISAVALRENRRVEREFGRLRVAAAPLPGGGCWVWWDESNLTAESAAQKKEAERHQILHDLGIMISHELANAMFSVSTYFQHELRQRAADDPGHPLTHRVAQDMERLKAMPHLLSTLYEMSKQPTARVDMKRVVQQVAKEFGGHVNAPETALLIWGHEKNLTDALVWFCREIIATRELPEGSTREGKITISLQQRRREDEAICLISISYPGLRIDQLKVGEPTSADEYPTVPVYLAREVIRFHYGTVHVGQGLDGPELMIAVKSRRVNALAEVEGEARPAPPPYSSATPFPPVKGAGADGFPASA